MRKARRIVAPARLRALLSRPPSPTAHTRASPHPATPYVIKDQDTKGRPKPGNYSGLFNLPVSFSCASQVEETPTVRRKQSKRRQAVLYSDDEDDEDTTPPVTTSKPSKRARTEIAEEIVDIDVEAEEDVNVDDDEPVEDTRFLPPEPSTSKRSAPKKTKTASKRPKKRAVVLSDDDGEDDYGDPEDVVIDDDDDFTPEPSIPKRSSASKSKSKTGKATAPDKPITVRDERKVAPSRGGGPTFPGKRGVLNDDGDGDDDSISKTDSVEAAAPPTKKAKLPPIKKNKPSTGTSTPTSVPAKPPPKPAVEADGLALSAAGARKPAATANNADFDLRDASVYASLFMKVRAA